MAQDTAVMALVVGGGRINGIKAEEADKVAQEWSRKCLRLGTGNWDTACTDQ